jgi:hypothetical protein
MSEFILKYRGRTTLVVESNDLDPGELNALKALGHQPHFSFARAVPDRLPQSDHDVLDDIALSILKGRKYSAPVGDMILEQARKRAAERGLQ